jgi:hypothetical protein
MNRATHRAAARGKKRQPGGVTPEETLRDAIRQHSAGDLREAEVVYHKVLSVMLQNADARLPCVLRHQQDAPKKASVLCTRARTAGARRRTEQNLTRNRRTDEAEAAYRRALADGIMPPLKQLGAALRARDDGDAVEARRRAVDISTFADAHQPAPAA